MGAVVRYLSKSEASKEKEKTFTVVSSAAIRVNIRKQESHVVLSSSEYYESLDEVVTR